MVPAAAARWNQAYLYNKCNIGTIQSTGSFIGTAHLIIGYKGVNGTYNSNAATPIQYSVTPPSLVLHGDSS